MNNTTYLCDASCDDQSELVFYIWHMDIHMKLILTIAYISIFIFGFGGNCGVVYFLGIKRERPPRGHQLIMALAVNDLLSSIIMPVVMLNDIASDFKWHLGITACVLLPHMNSLFFFASAWLLVAISYERLR